MQETVCKKMLPLCILDLLQEHSDAEHPVNSRLLLDLLQEKYGLTVERKAIFRNIGWLKEFGIDIQMVGPPTHGYYLKGRTFDDGQLRYLMDAVLSSRYIPPREAEGLVEKLQRMASRYFAVNLEHITTVQQRTRNRRPDLFQVLALLDRAIDLSRMVSFMYNDYGLDGHLQPRKDHRYLVSPYGLVTTNQQYYLVGNYDGYNDVKAYRLDLMTDIRMEELPARDARTLPGMERGMDPAAFVRKTVCWGGESPAWAKLRLPRTLMNDLVDAFGLDLQITPLPEGRMEADFLAAPPSVAQWALLHGADCEVLAPPELRAQLAHTAAAMANRYEDIGPAGPAT